MSGSSQPSEAGESDLAAGDADGSGARATAGGARPGRLRRLLGRREPRGAAPEEETAGQADATSGPGGEAAAPTDPIAEMRRDIAALWLAFSHQERTLRDLADRLEGSRDPRPAPQAQPTPADTHSAPAGDLEPGAEAPPAPDPGPVPVSKQLSDLDDVLASIERATETLERNHADEIGAAAEAGEHSGSEAGPPGEDEDEDPAGPPAGAG